MIQTDFKKNQCDSVLKHRQRQIAKLHFNTNYSESAATIWLGLHVGWEAHDNDMLGHGS